MSMGVQNAVTEITIILYDAQNSGFAKITTTNFLCKQMYLVLQVMIFQKATNTDKKWKKSLFLTLTLKP